MVQFTCLRLCLNTCYLLSLMSISDSVILKSLLWRSDSMIVCLFLGISKIFVPQIVFTRPDIDTLLTIFWIIRNLRLSQTSDVDSCSRLAQSLDFLRMRNCISHAAFGHFLTWDQSHWSMQWTKIAVMTHACWNKRFLKCKLKGGIKMNSVFNQFNHRCHYCWHEIFSGGSIQQCWNAT